MKLTAKILSILAIMVFVAVPAVTSAQALANQDQIENIQTPEGEKKSETKEKKDCAKTEKKCCSEEKKCCDKTEKSCDKTKKANTKEKKSDKE